MDSERIQNCLDLIRQARQLPVDDARRSLLEQAAGELVRDGRLRRRAEARAARRAADAKLLAATAMGATDRVMDAALPTRTEQEPALTVGGYVQLRPGPSTTRLLQDRTPDDDGRSRQLNRPQRCYVCKNHYRQVHAFYHVLCPACAEENLAHRTARTDLTGRRALLTGGRVKIGHQVGLMLLRDGAELTVTSRFPQDTVRRFAAAPDAATWWHRLRIAALDLRDPRQVLAFTDQMLSEGLPLDVLINNAAQTLRRSPQAYSALAAAEPTPTPTPVSLTAPRIWTAPGFSVPGPRTTPLPWTAELAPRSGSPDALDGVGHTADTAVAVPVPQGAVDEAGLLPETAATNSWTLRLGQVDPTELLEVQLVNAIAPFLLADRLLPLLEASPHPHRYLVNVSAVEGQFTVRNKSGDHPHTNMAKAALNMLTRTSAADLATRGIHTCSVDTGWVTDEKPFPARERHAATGWRPPLDVVDGAARVYHPVVQGQAGAPVHGVLLKDYRQVPW
ncbi:short subunit dehydrogenase [Streptomyces sp. CG 926]|uniref:SDR family NAD(P)-dependent oxidoreductase n=1 Tax=Streptomyces sp. CG 926 TaxID=1882405 RepID=UPI000D6D9355|nr:SDR family NAD(P)-dependent oxidoreductase [Streptomyces sp. CG 926]PWK64519.1 short subunit dehydrogenase [Streptomyces sp. CG 926]